MIPKRPSMAHTVLGKSLIKFTVGANGQRVPVFQWFTKAAWLATPAIDHEGKEYPRCGFIEVDPESVVTPPEATPEAIAKAKAEAEAAAKAEAEAAAKAEAEAAAKAEAEAAAKAEAKPATAKGAKPPFGN